MSNAKHAIWFGLFLMGIGIGWHKGRDYGRAEAPTHGVLRLVGGVNYICRQAQP